jgi:hypothetical protein
MSHQIGFTRMEAEKNYLDGVLPNTARASQNNDPLVLRSGEGFRVWEINVQSIEHTKARGL